MLFNSFTFMIFLPVVFLLYWFVFKRLSWQNLLILVASYVFYGWWDWRFLILIVITSASSFLSGLLIKRYEDRRPVQRAMSATNIVLNLGILAVFKYFNFFVDSFASMLSVFGFTVDWPTMHIILPVGISFYTFQALSYSIDVYARRIEPTRDPIAFFSFISFFPQLVAGPIVRAKEFIPQLHKPFFLGRTQFGFAVFWILNGLAKKLILSDYLAVNFCDRVFENPLLYTGFENLTALFGYSLQVYADFSGYTDIATGVAMLMGFYLPKNFNSPYKAKNAGEFWKRWHISLSKWLQDYLYIPLGGNRNGTFGSYAIILGIAFLASALAGSWWVFGSVLVLTAIVALLIAFKKSWRKELISDINRMDTMLLGGLWHGASWNFMIWGGLNGLGMLIYRFWASCNAYFKVLVIGLIVAAFGALRHFFPAPVFNMFFWWTVIILFGAFIGMLFHKIKKGKVVSWISGAWAVLMTFIFITFTRLFFRSGSNLDPAEANEKAWSTAKNMVNQIGGQWDWSLVPTMAWQHRSIILVFIIGMLIHWLPDNFKRRYRIWFAKMPLALMVIACAVAVFIICQFITADLQSFIYFQF